MVKITELTKTHSFRLFFDDFAHWEVQKSEIQQYVLNSTLYAKNFQL